VKKLKEIRGTRRPFWALFFYFF